MKLLFASPHITIHLHSGPVAALEINWGEPEDSQHLRHALSQALQLARRHQVAGWVTATPLLGTPQRTDLEWIGSDLLHPLDELGVQRLALVEPVRALRRWGIDNLLATFLPQTTIVARYFTTPEAARAWATQAA